MTGTVEKNLKTKRALLHPLHSPRVHSKIYSWDFLQVLQGRPESKTVRVMDGMECCDGTSLAIATVLLEAQWPIDHWANSRYCTQGPGPAAPRAQGQQLLQCRHISISRYCTSTMHLVTERTSPVCISSPVPQATPIICLLTWWKSLDLGTVACFVVIW